jgi:HSP20 family protein
MAITRWSPISDLLAVHSAMDRLFNETFTTGRRGRREVLEEEEEGFLPVDVYQTDKDWVIRAAVPGVDPQAVEVTCDGKTVTIKGEIPRPKGAKSEDYWIQENFVGKFLRQITLPEDGRCEESRAEFYNGMLVMTVPRAHPGQAQPKKIPVLAGGTTGSPQLESGSRQESTPQAGGARQPAATRGGGQ